MHARTPLPREASGGRRLPAHEAQAPGAAGRSSPACSRIEIVPGTGHSPMYEKPGETAKLMLDFTRGLRKRR